MVGCTKVGALHPVGLSSPSPWYPVTPCCCSVAESRPTLCDPRELQHTRLPGPSLSPWVCSNSCLLSQWCHPSISSSVTPFSSCPQSFPASVFFNESALYIRRPKHWSFSLSISPSNEYSGVISIRIDWFDLLAVQGTLKSLLQHHNSKASILQRSASFMVQPSYPYMTTGKTTALTIWTFVIKVMSPLFNTMSRFVIVTPRWIIKIQTPSFTHSYGLRGRRLHRGLWSSCGRGGL